MVGAVIGKDQINNMLTALAVNLRDISQQIINLSLLVNGQGQGEEYLAGIGFDDTPNPANPGGVSDAAWALALIGYLNTVASVYFGTAAQPSAFNFNQELSQIWAGQVS
jgi:hypothetical protein